MNNGSCVVPVPINQIPDQLNAINIPGDENIIERNLMIHTLICRQKLRVFAYSVVQFLTIAGIVFLTQNPTENVFQLIYFIFTTICCISVKFKNRNDIISLQITYCCVNTILCLKEVLLTDIPLQSQGDLIVYFQTQHSYLVCVRFISIMYFNRILKSFIRFISCDIIFGTVLISSEQFKRYDEILESCKSNYYGRIILLLTLIILYLSFLIPLLYLTWSQCIQPYFNQFDNNDNAIKQCALSGFQIKQLQRIPYHKNDSQSCSSTCAICFENFNENDVLIKLKCSPLHVFHQKCIETWLQCHAICPLCKKASQ